MVSQTKNQSRTRVLAALLVQRFQRTHSLEYSRLLCSHFGEVQARRHFHNYQCDYLKQMILDEVTQAVGRLEKCAARSHAGAFR
jgi:hypothetical protein